MKHFIKNIRTIIKNKRQFNTVASILGTIIVFYACNTCAYTLNDDVNNNIKITETVAVTETYVNSTNETMPEVIKIITTEPTVPETIVSEEETIEELVIEETKPVRENTLYYIEDDGYSYYLEMEYQDYLYNKLKEYGHPEMYEVCIALMYHESEFDKSAVSKTNDHGLMQINASNCKWLRKEIGIETLDDPYDNIDAGVYILVTNLEKYGSIEEALIAYNQGYCGKVKSTKYSRCILNHDLACLRKLEDK